MPIAQGTFSRKEYHLLTLLTMNHLLQEKNSMDSVEPPKIPDYVWWSLFTMCLIFPFAGVPAVLASNASRTYYKHGQYEMAAITSRRAFICNVIGLICAAVGLLIICIAHIVLALTGHY
ncbi:hypothetical protein FACS189454_07240 [Planctomycetales bacterium]|nr:hypothetical protein FACS189454_07240 [Planctomycetales bacterium]